MRAETADRVQGEAAPRILNPIEGVTYCSDADAAAYIRAGACIRTGIRVTCPPVRPHVTSCCELQTALPLRKPAVGPLSCLPPFAPGFALIGFSSS
jgi:hypothetical protein